MKRSATAFCLLLLALLWLGSAGPLQASTSGFKIIVHPENRVTTLDRAFVSRAYFKSALTWSDGKPIRPVDLPPDSQAREQFTKDVLKKSLSHLKNYWTQRIFSGTGLPPLQVESTAAMIAYVRAHPAALGYLPADADAGGTKVIQLR